ncbi:MAG TPA: diguanylate cyclase, partial [Longimicrobiales bacterium]|nr:diguanylate cyclase [Longimicrobiales bacterium]
MVASTRDDEGGGEGLVVSAERDHPVLMDPVTNLPNRLHFDVVYRVVFAAGTRGFPITVLLLEAAALQDAEDELRELARRLSAVTRRMDLLARFDERRFVALLL